MAGKPEFVIQFGFKTILHEFRNCFLEQILNILYASDI